MFYCYLYGVVVNFHLILQKSKRFYKSAIFATHFLCWFCKTRVPLRFVPLLPSGVLSYFANWGGGTLEVKFRELIVTILGGLKTSVFVSVPTLSNKL